MKKSYLLVLLLALAAACASAPTNREASSTNSTVTAPPASVAITEAAVIAKEKAVWDAIKNKDFETFGKMLADDEVEVLPDAVRDKAGSIAGVKEFEPTEVTFSNWKYLPIDKDAVVIVYQVDVKGKYQGKEFPPMSAWSSSAWVNRNGTWLAAYHQECDVSKEPMPPPPKSSPAKAGATPASTPTPATTGPDPIANENAVWAALKSKNYDGFAALIAPDSIEVEPSGVYDKAGSVKGVSTIDFSKAQLSEFKSASFDKDAALVTYQVKLPGEPAERHSTIWALRNGKWLAVFHHGTPIPKGTPAAAPSPKAAATPSPK
jgi:hypothetical protein